MTQRTPVSTSKKRKLATPEQAVISAALRWNYAMRRFRSSLIPSHGLSLGSASTRLEHVCAALEAARKALRGRQ